MGLGHRQAVELLEYLEMDELLFFCPFIGFGGNNKINIPSINL